MSGGFLNYLDEFEKRIDSKPIKENTQQTKKVLVPVKKFVIKKKVITENKVKISEPKKELTEIDKATSILEGIDDYGYSPGRPSSSMYYDDTSMSSKIKNTESKYIMSKAMDILGGGDDYDGSPNQMPLPLMDVPNIDESLLQFVPKEMLSEEHKQKVVQTTQNKVENKEAEVPQEVKQMMEAMAEQTKQLQQMCINVDMSSIPQEFLN